MLRYGVIEIIHINLLWIFSGYLPTYSENLLKIIAWLFIKYYSFCWSYIHC